MFENCKFDYSTLIFQLALWFFTRWLLYEIVIVIICCGDMLVIFACLFFSHEYGQIPQRIKVKVMNIFASTLLKTNGYITVYSITTIFPCVKNKLRLSTPIASQTQLAAWHQTLRLQLFKYVIFPLFTSILHHVRVYYEVRGESF